MAPVPDHRAALREHFGFTAFRPGQEAAVAAALAGRDVLVVMPTGAGKSLCYQLPALVGEDLTVVVSPLVALMADQARALARRAPGAVAQIDAQQPPGANAAALDAAVRGAVRVLHVSPERFAAPGFVAALRHARVGLFVVDEAHCVSEWGHDFRPDYSRLGEAARALGARCTLASTATATPRVAADVVARLGLRDPVRIATGFDRPNLSFAVARSPAPAARERQLVAALQAPGATPAIVYAGTRRAVDDLSATLGDALGRPVVAYHAGLAPGERWRAQRRFMDGEADVVVATNAFGMGIDKADVRSVVHVSVPASVEAYYQEAGRAGRDGLPAQALLLAADEDRGLHVHFARRAELTAPQVAAVALALEAAAGGGPVVALPGLEGGAPRFAVGSAGLGDADPERVRAILGVLERVGVLRLDPAPVGEVRGVLLDAWGPRAAARAAAVTEEAQHARWRRYHAVWSFVQDRACRRAALLAHFEDPAAPNPAGPCCDVCDAALVAGVAAAGAPVDDTGPAALDAAIVATVRAAGPVLGRREVAAVLHGTRSRALRSRALDGLPAYGTFDHLRTEELLAAVDALVVSGGLEADAGLLAAPVAATQAADGRAAA